MSRRSILHLRLGGGRGRREKEPLNDALADFCRRTTPVWEPGPAGAYLDISGTSRLYGNGLDGAALVSGLARQHGFVRSAGTGPTRLSARLASWYAARAGGGVLSIRHDQVSSFLRPVPVRFLTGGSPVIYRLRQLGVRTLGDLQVVPRNLLRSVFGGAGVALADEAWGRESAITCGWGRDDKAAGPILVAGVRLPRPVSRETVVSALLRGLAVRALTRCPGGPVSRGRWRLTAFWPENVTGQSTVRGAEDRGLNCWLALVDLLWNRLPERRKGVLGLELAAGPPESAAMRQGELYPVDVADRRLAEAVRRARTVSEAGLGLACEDQLRRLGAVWYGEGEDPRPGGRGLVDGGRSSR